MKNKPLTKLEFDKLCKPPGNEFIDKELSVKNCLKFENSCFLKAPKYELNDLINWLERVGYKINFSSKDHYSIVTDNSIGFAYVGPYSHIGKINCGNNIELFKSIAAMNSRNDVEQWFIDKDGFMMKGNRGYSEEDFKKLFRKATVEEIFKYYKINNDDKE